MTGNPARNLPEILVFVIRTGQQVIAPEEGGILPHALDTEDFRRIGKPDELLKARVIMTKHLRMSRKMLATLLVRCL